MVGFASKRRLGGAEATGLRNRRLPAGWYEEAAARMLVQGEAGARLLAKPHGASATIYFEFPDAESFRTTFPQLWQEMEPRLRAEGVNGRAYTTLEEPRNRRFIEPVLQGQLFAVSGDYVVLERRDVLGADVEPLLPDRYSARPFSSDDISSVWELRRSEFSYYDGTLEETREELREVPWSAVARRGDEFAGFCWVSTQAGHTYLDTIAVAEGHRGKGLGEALLVAALAWCRDNLPGPVRLHTDVGHREAMSLYSKHGFHQAFSGVEYSRPMDPAAIAEILGRRKNTYSRWLGYR